MWIKEKTVFFQGRGKNGQNTIGIIKVKQQQKNQYYDKH